MTPTEKRKARNWLDFHRRNPIVFDTYCRLILSEIGAGRCDLDLVKISREVLWDAQVIKVSGYRRFHYFDPYFARLVAAHHPNAAPFIKLKPNDADAINYRAIVEGDDRYAIPPLSQYEFDLGFEYYE